MDVSIQSERFNEEQNESKEVATMSTANMKISVRKYGNAKRDESGHIIRGYEGIDIKQIYDAKPLSYKFLKRLFDVILSAFGLILLSPIFLITAIAIKLEDGGPVFFSGMRWGKDFKYFPMHKFRSMCVNAEAMTGEVVKESDKNGMAFKIAEDPRMTNMGKFMRRNSIDELPQLFNVLKGEMSLVGPRPIQTTTEDGDPYDMQRWCVKPGITCIWQIDGRSDVEWDEWVEMDLEYINRMSLAFDFKLLMGTVKAVLHKSGAV